MIEARKADEYDKGIANERNMVYMKIRGPRVGDFAQFPDGHYERFSHNWGEDGFQTSEGGSFFLGSGYVSFSGGLNPTIPLSRIEATGEYKTGAFWIFHHNDKHADNGVGITIQCRVFKILPKVKHKPEMEVSR